MSKSNGSKKRKNALYYSLAVCVVAGSVAAFTIFGSSPSDNGTLDNSTKKSVTSIKEDSGKQANVPTTDVSNNVVEDISDAYEVAAQAHVTDEDLSGNIPYESDYILPLSTEIMRDYSNGEFVYSEISGDYRIHNGIDFTASKGTGVKSIITGRVISISKDPLLGTVVEVDHGNKLTAKYCGLSSVTVKEGDFLLQGDQIGVVDLIPAEGDTSHMHFETLLDGVYIDPLAVMGKAEGKTDSNNN